MIKKYKDPSGPLKPAKVLINGRWVELQSNKDGTLSAGGRQFKVNHNNRRSLTGGKLVVVTPKGNRVVNGGLEKAPTTYNSTFNGNDIMVPVKKGFELLGQGLYAGALGAETALTYGPFTPLITLSGSKPSTPVTDATFKYALPYTMPSKWVGWARTGYAPHREENIGFGDEDTNLLFDVATVPFIFKGIKGGIKYTPKAVDFGLETASDMGSKVARDLRVAREMNKVTEETPTVKSNSLAHLQRPNSKLSLAERVGVPKGERATWDPQVMANARKFALKYGYEIPLDIEAAKNMYRLHNTFFRTVNMELFKPDPYDDIVIPGFEESHAAPSGMDLYPELKGLSDLQLKYQVATKGYPKTIISRKPGEPLFNNLFVFVAPDFGFTKMFNTWDPFENTVTVRRPFSFGNPLNWHKNADWRPISALDSEVPYTKGEARLGNWGPEKEVKLSTEHLYPVKMTSPLDKGSLVGKYLKEQNNQYKQGGKMNKIDFAKSGIHIKKKNRGKFTEYCGGKVTSACIARGKASSSPTIRKRATFAANARKWHKLGGIITQFRQEGGVLYNSSYLIPEMSPKKVILPPASDNQISLMEVPKIEAQEEKEIVFPKFEESFATTTLLVTPQAKEGDDAKTISQILNEEGIKHIVTSGYRPGSHTTSGHRSNHSKLDASGNPMAFDIVPKDGDFEKFRLQIYSNPRIVAWMKSHRWGIIEETAHQTNGDSGYLDPDSGTFKKTGFKLGNHFHFGPDSVAVRGSSRYMKYDT